MAKSDDASDIDPRIACLGDLEFDGCFLEALHDEEDPEGQSEAKAYLKELQRLSGSELDRRYRKARREQSEREQRAREKRRQHYEHWGSAPFWTLEEAAALVSDQIPATDPTRTCGFPGIDFDMRTEEEERVCNLAKRHRSWGKKDTEINPGEFLEWAKDNDFTCPDDLEKAVRVHGHHRVDWRQKSKEYEAKLKKGERRIQQLEVEISKLREKNSRLEKEAAQSVGKRERDTFNKLLAGMSTGGYAYNPKKQRNEASSQIQGDIERLGLSMDRKTLLQKLNASFEIVDQDILADLN